MVDENLCEMVVLLGDVKRNSNGDFKILEFSNPCDSTSKEMDFCLQKFLVGEKYNPLQKDVVIMGDDRYEEDLITSDIISFVDKSNLLENSFGGDDQILNFKNYDSILLDRSQKSTFPPVHNSFLLNDVFWNQVGNSKELQYLCSPDLFPKTYFFDELDFENCCDLWGEKCIVKGVGGSRSLGFFVISELSKTNLASTVNSFDLRNELIQHTGVSWEDLSDSLKEIYYQNIKPALVQEFVDDFPIYCAHTKQEHVSVDRVGAIIANNQGDITVDFIGGFHRFGTTPFEGESSDVPLCIQRGTAFGWQFSKEYANEIEEFFCRATKKLYSDSLYAR